MAEGAMASSKSRTAARRRPSDSDGADVIDIVAAIEDGSRAVTSSLREQLERRPWATIGVATAVGWVLGGGLTPRLAALLVATAGRATLDTLVAAAVRGVQASRPSAES